jgi:enamine deaminase RidA (YjgF/YER057c/UK114 family)
LPPAQPSGDTNTAYPVASRILPFLHEDHGVCGIPGLRLIDFTCRRARLIHVPTGGRLDLVDSHRWHGEDIARMVFRQETDTRRTGARRCGVKTAAPTRNPHTTPAGHTPPAHHRQVAIASGSKLVFIAGQVAWDTEGVTIGEGDLAAQVEQSYLNTATALAEADGSFDDVAKLTFYVVDRTADKMPPLLEGISRAAAKLRVTPMPPATLIGVAALDVPEHLVEIESTAVVD